MIPERIKGGHGIKASPSDSGKVAGARVTKTSKRPIAVNTTAFAKGSSTCPTDITEQPKQEATNSYLPYNDQIVAGEGCTKQLFHKLTVDQSSKPFLQKPRKRVNKDLQYRKKLAEDAKTYPVLTESTIVECNDGARMIYFIKGGVFTGLTEEEGTEKRNQSMQAIEDLLRVYDPILPDSDHSRHPDGCDAERSAWEAKGLKWGRLYFAYWHERGGSYRPATLSSDSRPESQEALAGVKNYMEKTAWEHHQLSAWLKALEPGFFEEQSGVYRKLRDEGKLQYLDQGEDACHTGAGLLVNIAVSPHKDLHDAQDSWTGVACHGDFKGGDQVFVDFKIKVRLQPGDLILAHYGVLEHFVEEIVEGARYGQVWFTRQDVLRPPTRLWLCPIPGCRSGYGLKSNLQAHLRGTQRTKLHNFSLEETQSFLNQVEQSIIASSE